MLEISKGDKEEEAFIAGVQAEVKKWEGAWKRVIDCQGRGTKGILRAVCVSLAKETNPSKNRMKAWCKDVDVKTIADLEKFR